MAPKKTTIFHFRWGCASVIGKKAQGKDERTMDIVTIIGLTLIGGVCIPLGGLLASVEHIHQAWLETELRHFVIALGGGILLGAVAEVLIPEGVASLPNAFWSLPLICVGGLAIFALELHLGLRHRRSLHRIPPNLDSRIVRQIWMMSRQDSPQMLGMLLDYIPEAIALGGLVALGSPNALLLAVLIGLQNIPEGFNTYRELMLHTDERHNGQSQKNKSRRILLSMVRLAFLGPISGLGGFFLLSGHQGILGMIMLISSGGILYLIFQDIAPQSHLEKHWAPPLGAVFGFAIAMLGELLLGGGS